MEKNEVPTPSREGIVYGELTYWLLVIGMTIAIAGLVIYLISPGYLGKASLMAALWQGYDCHTIWETVAGVSQPLPWYSCLGLLSKGDMLATLGIAVTCLAAMFGMWGEVFHMVRNRGRLYLIFALIIAVVLTLSASGLITMEH